MTAHRAISTAPTIRCLVPMVLLSATWTLVGCPGDQLPEGWEDAQAVDEIAATDRGATDPDDPDLGTVVIGGNVDRLEILYIDSFPCSDELEAHKRVEGADVDILVQPTDLHPDAVAGSDCTLQVDMVVLDLDEGTYHVTVYRRDNDHVDPDLEVVMVGEGDAVLGFAE